MLYRLARAALFRLDAEAAHELALETFQHFPNASTALFTGKVPVAPVECMGLKFRNPIGLAAGLDKNADALAAWQRLGFGFAEVGTVTPRPQDGNPKPRMFRIPEHQAIINRMGFNNKGVDYLVERVKEADFDGVLGINIGKNATTPIEHAATDYVICLEKVYNLADYVTVNISSPNTKNLRDLQQEAQLRELLTRLTASREQLSQQYGIRVPMLVKIAPDVSEEQLEVIARLAPELGIDGLIATNTTIGRPGLETHPLAAQAGGLSGAPLRALSQATLARLRLLVGPDYPLIGVGGITSGTHARERFEAGADLVQIYSGFIYHGPRLIRDCVEAFSGR